MAPSAASTPSANAAAIKPALAPMPPAASAVDGDGEEEDDFMSPELFVSVDALDDEIGRCTKLCESHRARGADGDDEALELDARILELNGAKIALFVRVEKGELTPPAYLAAVAAAVREDGARARSLLAGHRAAAAEAVMRRMRVMQQELKNAVEGGLGGDPAADQAAAPA